MSAVAGDEHHEELANGTTQENGIAHNEDVVEQVLAGKEVSQPVVEDDDIHVSKPVAADEPSEHASAVTIDGDSEEGATVISAAESAIHNVRCRDLFIELYSFRAYRTRLAMLLMKLQTTVLRRKKRAPSIMLLKLLRRMIHTQKSPLMLQSRHIRKLLQKSRQRRAYPKPQRSLLLTLQNPSRRYVFVLRQKESGILISTLTARSRHCFI